MKSLYYYTVLLFFSCLCNSLAAQTFFNIQGSPLDTIPYNNSCISLTASHLPIQKTTQYGVTSIPYTPLSMLAATNVPLQDDKFSTSIPLGFNFCFFGNTYTQLVISANGQLTFNTSYAGNNCSFATQQPLPYYNSEFPDNSLFVPFVDFNISLGGSISYGTEGIAPFRKFIVRYDSIPYFGGFCNLGNANFQCVLNETFNTIDVFIGNKNSCNSNPFNWLNYATIGIQSIGAVQSVTVPGHNASIWTANNEGWEFFPNGGNAAHTNWFDINMVMLASNTDSFLYCSYQFPQTIVAQTTYECVNLTFSDTLTLVKVLPQITSITTSPTSCKNMVDGGVTVNALSSYPPIQYNLGILFSNTTGVFTNVPYGNQQLTITDALGCSDTSFLWANTSSTLTAIINVTSPVTCPSNLGSVCAQVYGGVPPYMEYSKKDFNIFNLEKWRDNKFMAANEAKEVYRIPYNSYAEGVVNMLGGRSM